jgi:hypothetical protein
VSKIQFEMHGLRFTMDRPFPKMDPTIKQEWLKDLRSGEFKQGRFTLRNENDCLCCLGVLCFVYQESVGNINYRRLKRSLGWAFGNGVNMPPDEVYHWAKMPIVDEDTGRPVTTTVKRPDGTGDEYTCANGFSYVSRLNDLFMWNFEQIADFVEAQL